MFQKIKDSYLKFKQSIENKRYKKYISKFYSPIKEDINIDGLSEFDLVDVGPLGGKCSKRFVMFDRSLFSKYLSIIKNGKSFFESYLNDEDIKNEIIPSKLSVLLKKDDSPFDEAAEVFSCFVLNFFECETCFNTIVTDDKGTKYLASLDFIRKNEEFFTLSSLAHYTYYFSGGSGFEKIYFILRLNMDRVFKVFGIRLSKNEKNEIIDKVLYSCMVRKFVLKDKDSKSGNFGLLVNKKEKKIRFCPNFDYNYIFQGEPNYERDLNWIYKNKRHLYDKFVSCFKAFADGQNYKNIIEDNVDEKYVSTFLTKIRSSSGKIFDVIQEIQAREDYKNSFKNLD